VAVVGHIGSLVADTETAARIGFLVDTAVVVVLVGPVAVVVAVAVSVAVHTIQAAFSSCLHPLRSVQPTDQDQFAPAVTILHSPPPKRPSFLWE